MPSPSVTPTPNQAAAAGYRRLALRLGAPQGAGGVWGCMQPDLPPLLWVQWTTSADATGSPPRRRPDGGPEATPSEGTAAATLRLGFDVRRWRPGQRLPRHWPSGVRLEWVPCDAPAQAQAWLRAENMQHSCGPGTVAAIVRALAPPHRLFALTAGHVLGGGYEARSGDPVQLRLPLDDGSAVGGGLNGRAFDWSPQLGQRDTDARFDAGLVEISEDDASALVEHLAWPTGWAEPQPDASVRLLTRQHQLAGVVKGVLVSTLVQCGDPAQQYVLRDAWCYQVDAGSLAGDSGAALWDAQDRLIGLHMGLAPAGCAGNALASPIQRVLDWAGCEPVLRNEPLQREQRTVRIRALPETDPVVPLAAEGARAADVLARTMWAEARGEPDADAGMRAVAHVVLNRRDAQRWWGHSVEAVCTKPSQFSCWNEGDPNRRQLLAVRRGDALFDLALAIAEWLLTLDAGERIRSDTTGGATHYHATSMAHLPNWAVGQAPVRTIGHHAFYCGIA